MILSQVVCHSYIRNFIGYLLLGHLSLLKFFEDMLNGRIPIEGRNLLVTFDDGFKSNLQISKEVLEPLDIQAIFFPLL